MKDEVKEILEKLKDNIPTEEYRSEGTSDGLTHYEEDKDSWQYKLLDYITNLQQENERLKKERDTYKQQFRITHNDLETYIRKYECLQEDLKGQENLTLSYCKSEQDYKSRCEKAIEYIDKQKKKMYKSRNKIALFVLMKLESILQNGSEENEN